MTRKDFQTIADVLKAGRGARHNDRATIDATARRFANALAAEHPRFNKEVFLAACGMYDEQLAAAERELLAPKIVTQAGGPMKPGTVTLPDDARVSR